MTMTRQFMAVALLASLVSLVAGCGSEQAAPTSSDAAAPGALLLQPFKVELQQALKAGLAEGPIAAIDACRIEAPKIAAEQSASGVRMGRSSHRLRNPANDPPAWVAPIMDDYRDDASGRSPVTVSLANGRKGYAEPILLQPMCTVCHGDSIDDALAGQILESYPDDRATGFSAGDLRGVFWVEYPPGT